MQTTLNHNSRAIFRQLAAVPGASGVKTIIENHDAWLHSEETEAEITAALRLEAVCRPRSASLNARLEANRQALSSLVVQLPSRLAHAG